MPAKPMQTPGDAGLWQQASTIIEQGIRQLSEPPHNVPPEWFTRQAARYV